MERGWERVGGMVIYTNYIYVCTFPHLCELSLLPLRYLALSQQSSNRPL
jgi:hypothetical protein